MTISRFGFPTPIHFGPGARREVAAHLAQQGIRRPLVVTDRGIAPLPLLKAFLGDLAGLEAADSAMYVRKALRRHEALS